MSSDKLKPVSNDNLTIKKVKSRFTIKKKFDNQPQFIQFYVENLDFVMSNFSQTEMKVLGKCVKEMGINKIIRLSAEFRKDLERTLKTTKVTISRSINVLIEKKVLIELEPEKMSQDDLIFYDIDKNSKKLFLINPDIFGKASLRDMVKMRESIVKEFDFEQMEFVKRVDNEREYAGFDDIIENPHKHKIKNITSSNNLSGGQNVEILLEENKQPNSLAENAPKLLDNSDVNKEEIIDAEISDNRNKNSDYEAEMAKYMELQQKLQEQIDKLKKWQRNEKSGQYRLVVLKSTLKNYKKFQKIFLTRNKICQKKCKNILYKEKNAPKKLQKVSL